MNPFDARLLELGAQGIAVDVFGDPLMEISPAAIGKTIRITDQVRAQDQAAARERQAQIGVTWKREGVRRG